MVVWRNGNIQIYLPIKKGHELIDIKGGYCGIDGWDENLKDIQYHNKSYDIMEILECEDADDFINNFKSIKWNLIWKREPEIEDVEEISAQEAMNRLEQMSGKKIKIVSQ